MSVRISVIRHRGVSPAERRAHEAREQAMRVIQANPVMLPLLDLFAVVDDVLTIEDAFSQEHIKKSLGRIHREWKKCRGSIDPEFDPKRYPKRPRQKKQPKIGKRLALQVEPKE